MSPLAPEDPRLPSPPEQPPGIWRTWSRGQIFFGGLLLLMLDFSLQILVYGLREDLFLPVLLGSALGVVVPCMFIARLHGGSLRTEFHVGPVAPTDALRAALFAFAAAVPLSWLTALSLRVHPMPEDHLQFFTSHLPTAPAAIALSAFAVIVVAPLAEELLFRGVLYRLSRGLWGSLPAAVISALCFTLVHGEPWYFFGLLALGFLLAFLYEMTRSITVCWITHGTHNAISFWLLLADRNGEIDTATDGLTGWIPALISLVCLAFLCYRFIQQHRAERPDWE